MWRRRQWRRRRRWTWRTAWQTCAACAARSATVLSRASGTMSEWNTSFHQQSTANSTPSPSTLWEKPFTGSLLWYGTFFKPFPRGIFRSFSFRRYRYEQYCIIAWWTLLPCRAYCERWPSKNCMLGESDSKSCFNFFLLNLKGWIITKNLPDAECLFVIPVCF